MTVYIVEYFDPEYPENGSDLLAVYANQEAAKAHRAEDPAHLLITEYRVKSEFQPRRGTTATPKFP